ncbi:MAG: Crp/Fnr family transcriptional regulator [Negativicutes bacterium]|nr:Crp/Fnr family transcriptional regulator [Negativicutes bacterium]
MKKDFQNISRVDLFADISETELNSLFHCLSARQKLYSKGEIIFAAGSAAELVGIVLSGQVQIIHDDYYGNRTIIAEIESGQMFGETYTCAKTAALPFSVVAKLDSAILLIDYKKIITTCNQACVYHHKLVYNMLQIIVAKNLTLNQKIMVLSKRSSREKLLAFLSTQAQKANSNEFNISLSRQDLADFLSLDRSAMSHELSKLREEGVLEFQKNHFKLLCHPEQV